jgi:hypothetical protein
MVPRETGRVTYVTLSLLVTSSTPGIPRTTVSTTSLSSTLPTAPCNVTTKEHELTLIPDVPFHRLPRAPRYPSRRSLGTRVSRL